MKKILTNPFVIGAFLGIISLHFYRELSHRSKSAPPPLVDVPTWTLIDENGSAFGSEQLAGKVFVANFFFTSCPSICPRLIADMKRLHDHFLDMSDKIHFVSFTVDPETDLPAVLKAYKEKHANDSKLWTFVTGEHELVYKTIVEDMKIHVGDKKMLNEKENLYDISHMAHFALFDQKGRLRALLDTSSMGLAAMESAAKLLITQQEQT